MRVPHIRAVCEDESLLGVPFYVADYIVGYVLTSFLPTGLDDEASRRRLGEDLVDALVEIHSVDVNSPELARLVRPGSYLERQVRRFSGLWWVNATRPLPLVAEVGERLAASLPEPLARSSSMATSGWATRSSPSTARSASSPSWTGRWEPSAIHVPTSDTYSPLTPNPMASRALSAPHR